MKRGLLIATILIMSATASFAEVGFDPRYERDYNIFNWANQYAPDNPLNPANKYDPDMPSILSISTIRAIL